MKTVIERPQLDDTTTDQTDRQFIYLDYAATTPTDPLVSETVFSVMNNRRVANPHAKHHMFGATAASIVESARVNVASAICAQKDEIIFTAGATESNNLVLKGLLDYLLSSAKAHVITSAVEHKSVLEPIKWLQSKGVAVTILEPKPCGMIEADMVQRALKPDTGLVSIQAVNNETGTINPLSEIREILDSGILFHTDASQILGKAAFSVGSSGVDFASLSAHKAYGPQGVGATFVRTSRLDLLEPLSLGGRQEKGLRAGTVPVALCAGFGTTCALLDDDRERLQEMREVLIERLSPVKPVIHGHSDPLWNVPGILNLRFKGIDTETLVMELPELGFGQGSACNSGGQGSHVIKAITGSDVAAQESLRLSFGRFTTLDEIEEAAAQIVAVVSTIRVMQGVC